MTKTTLAVISSIGSVYIELFAKGLLVGLVVAVPVGPTSVLCLNRFLTGGLPAGLVSGLGVATADATGAAIALLGLTLISGFLDSHQVWLRFGGGLFLCYLGLRTFLDKPSNPAASRTGKGLWAYYLTTFLVTFVNPVTVSSFLAIFAAFSLGAASEKMGTASALVSGVFTGSVFWWLVLSGVLSVFPAGFSATGYKWFSRISGLIIVAFGFRVLVGI